MKRYIIDEETLRDLLYHTYKYEALEYGGVDNWEWYGESEEDYLDFVLGTTNLRGMDIEDGFDYLVEDELKKYCELPKNWQSPKGE